MINPVVTHSKEIPKEHYTSMANVFEEFSCCLEAAKRGDANAQTEVGASYHMGKGVARDYAQALIWYRKAAQQGNPTAESLIGNIFRDGLGVEADQGEASYWYHRAASKGSGAAQNNLGHLYANGKGVPRIYAEALSWYHKAADQDLPAAQYNLGRMYEKGCGVEIDFNKALYWFHRAAKQGDASAQGCIGRMYELGEGVARDLVSARMWYKMSADQGESFSISALERLQEPLQRPAPVVGKPDSFESRNLWEDLKHHSGEVYKNGDATAGFKLLRELFGFVTVLLFLAQLEFFFTGGRSSVAFNCAVSRLLKMYMSLGEDERRKVRACVSVARSGFGLFSSKN